jgi:hypothetical protein
MDQRSAERPQCLVRGAEKLPAEVGGGNAICSAIVAATRATAPGADYKVEVEVESASALVARVTLKDGRTLAEQRLTVSDRQLNAGSIERFAAAIAGAVAGSAGR